VCTTEHGAGRDESISQSSLAEHLDVAADLLDGVVFVGAARPEIRGEVNLNSVWPNVKPSWVTLSRAGVNPEHSLKKVASRGQTD
jgi:hypothetical protein